MSKPEPTITDLATLAHVRASYARDSHRRPIRVWHSGAKRAEYLTPEEAERLISELRWAIDRHHRETMSDLAVDGA